MSPNESTRSAPDSRAGIWWLHPFWIMVAPLLVIATVAFLLPESDFRDNWRTAKVFDGMDFALCLAVAAAFSTGCVLASCIESGFCHHRRVAPGLRDIETGQRELKLLFDIMFLATMLGYVVWFASILKGGGLGMIASVLRAEKGVTDELKRTAGDSMIAGITTLTQLGMGAALLGTCIGFTHGWRKVRLQLALLLCATGLRAVFLSERLSLIEVVLPSLVLWIRLAGYGRPGSALRRFLVVAPFAGIVLLYVLFTFTEYFRSWATFYSDREEQSLLWFSMLRLLGYYVTGLNNGAIEWHAHGALNFPYATMDWLWNFPVIGEVLQGIFGGNSDPADMRTVLLKADGNPEFNNPSGIFVVFTDMGVPAGLLLFAAYGCVAALLYGSYRRGSALGMLLYSFLFVGMCEQLRIFYIAEGRAFPTWIMLIIAGLAVRPSSLRRISFRKPAREALI